MFRDSFMPFYLRKRENDVNVPSKSNKQKNLERNKFFVGVLAVKDENSRTWGRIRIPWSEARIRGSSSIPKCHRSTKQYKTIEIAVFYYFCVMLEGSRSVPQTNGAGSGNHRILRILWIFISFLSSEC